MQTAVTVRSLGLFLLVIAAACGGSSGPPTSPGPPIVNPPANALPSIDAITAQGRRARQPARFADVRETIDVAATVRDAETPIDELTYQWSATVGSITGSGRAAVWTAPDAAPAPSTVTITLKVIEAFGHPGQPKNFTQDVSGTVAVRLHDSAKEVGDMSRRFLTEFSKTQTNRDWQDIMKDFKREACPVPREYDDERAQVVNHYSNFTMHNYDIGPAEVGVNFGGTCAYGLPGDACATVPVMWDSTGPSGRSTTRGLDHLTAVYSTTDSRWWLCSSRLQGVGSLFYLR